MSTTTEVTATEFTADLITRALIAEARRSGGHRRLYLAGILGMSPQAIFDAFSHHLDPNHSVSVGPTQSITLHAVPLDAGEDPRLLIPYLVGEARPNGGSAGFAALLRDEVPTGAIPRVLLILDEQPVETVRTAAENVVDLAALGWRNLLHAAIEGAELALQPLLNAVIDDSGRLAKTADTIAILHRMAVQPDPTTAGAELYKLGYLKDHLATQEPPKRLKRAAKWRERLELWSTPGQDLERHLRQRYDDLDDPGLAAILAARTPFGLDYSRFTLDDMPPERPRSRKLRLSRPLRTRGASCKSLPGRAVVWCKGGGSFSVLLTSGAAAASTAKIIWSDGSSPDDIHIAVGDSEISLDVNGGGWHYARIELSDGDGADLAIFTGNGDWAPFEASLDLDLGASAFRTSETPMLIAMGEDGSLIGQPAVAMPPGEPGGGDGEPVSCMARLGTQTQPIELLIGTTGTDDEPSAESGDSENLPDDDWHVESGPGKADDQETGSTDADNRVNGLPTPTETVESVPHAKLKDSRSGEPVVTSSFTLAHREGKLVGVIGTLTPNELVNQRLSDTIDGLDLEGQILTRPGVTAFLLDRTGSGAVLDRHSYLDGLDLTAVPTDAWLQFMRTRDTFFQALRPHGSVHAVGAGHAMTEARAYVDAYSTLLDMIIGGGGRFLAEYEKLVLCDSVADPETGELYIAPTNPVTVEYMLTFTAEIDRWLPRASDVLEPDLRTCTTRHLLPSFSTQGVWYEIGPAAPLLWRRYWPQSRANPGDNRSGYIARRIDHFLSVHPAYRDERQVLSLAFHEPGDGRAVVGALRRLVAKYLKPGSPPMPRLNVTIISSSETPTEFEGMLNGTALSRPTEAQHDRVLRDRVSVKRAAPHDHQPEFAHVSFVFQSSLDRAPAAVDVGSRAGTLYCGGLATAPGRHTEPGRNETTFYWGTFAGPADRDGLPALMRKTMELVGGMPRDYIAPGRTRMPSTRVSSGFLGDLYESSAWVVHLDRLLGLEAFAPDATGKHARYLIDYEDRADTAQPGLDAITATARVAPYQLALRRALVGLGRPTDTALDRLLRIFNGVSGKWALDLIGANINDLHERIGLAAAIASLQDIDGGLGGDATVGLVIPLREMLDALPTGARPASGELCDDLLYLRVPLGEAAPRLRARLIEVKYRGAAAPRTALNARDQLTHTHDWLLATFGTGNGPRRPFRSRDLAELIRSSAVRATAFGLLKIDDRTGFERAVDAVGRGEYTLDLAFAADGTVLYGDFISIERDSAVAAHRQLLTGTGLPLGHLRLGRPALEALTAGKPLPRPVSLPTVTFPDDNPPQGGFGPTDPTPQPVPPPADTPEQAPPAGTSANANRDDSTAAASRPAEITQIAGKLDDTFARYGLAVEPFLPERAQLGPSVIRFRTRTLGRLSISEIERRSRDISREIAAQGEIQVSDEPGFVTIDVPRTERQSVPLHDVFADLDADSGSPGALQFVAGIAPSGHVRIADLSRLPHLLVAGATGSGKSVFLRGLLVELLRARTPEQLHLLIIDPKRLDFAPFARTPHVRGGSIISDPDEALERLRTTLEAELERRQPVLERAGVSSAAEYYEAGGRLEDLPQLVILVDEFADLVLAGTDRKAFSELIQRYAQLTRAYGIFLVLATQRPSVDVVTGSIKANLSARIAFSLPSTRDSMTVLDRGGAEDLLGNGDLLFYRNGRTERLQAPLATLADVRTVVP